eukprot:SAG22_NODE_1452_length_4395_cov_2.925745_2_plen_47_part_00
MNDLTDKVEKKTAVLCGNLLATQIVLMAKYHFEKIYRVLKIEGRRS